MSGRPSQPGHSVPCHEESGCGEGEERRDGGKERRQKGVVINYKQTSVMLR